MAGNEAITIGAPIPGAPRWLAALVAAAIAAAVAVAVALSGGSSDVPTPPPPAAAPPAPALVELSTPGVPHPGSVDVPGLPSASGADAEPPRSPIPEPPAPLAATRVLSVTEGWDVPEATPPIAFGNGFGLLRVAGDGWEWVSSRDGFRWTTAPVVGDFAGADASVVLSAGGAGVRAVSSLAGSLEVWESDDGINWARVAGDRAIPDFPGMRWELWLHENGVAGGDEMLVLGSAVARPDWQLILGVDPDDVQMSSGGSGRLRARAGDRAYVLDIAAVDDQVSLRVSDESGAAVFESMAPVPGDPKRFVGDFLACGGFAPVQIGTIVGSDVDVPAPFWPLSTVATQDGYLAVADGDGGGSVRRWQGGPEWERIEAAALMGEEGARVNHLVLAGSRLVAVGSAPPGGGDSAGREAAWWTSTDGSLWTRLAGGPTRSGVEAVGADDRTAVALVHGQQLVVAGASPRAIRAAVSLGRLAVRGDTVILEGWADHTGARSLWAVRLPGVTPIAERIPH